MRQRIEHPLRRRDGGVALVIVLAFVVLLTLTVVAYLSRTGIARHIAHGDFHDARSDQLARSAIDLIVSDLKQEILDGSTASTVNGYTLYLPASLTNISPMRSGCPAGNPNPIPNLVRRSVRMDAIAAPGRASRASAVNSSTDVSPDGRSISNARWNKHYLIPRDPAFYSGANINKVGTDPVPQFTAPDWVLVTSDGPAVMGTPSDATIGRYAFAIYNEGGLLDMNVAGYPQAATAAQYGPKGLLAFADLRQVFGTTTSARNQIDNLVGWRNYASGQATGSFPSLTCSATSYFNSVIKPANDFLATSPAQWNSRSDQAFVSRQELIDLRSTTGFTQAALHSLGTFSRIVDYPTWGNAAMLRVASSFARRSDGTIAQPGEPLFRRFPITHLAWLGSTGILAPGDAASVKRDFGLVWNSDHWDYCGAIGSAIASSVPPITGSSEPDFFQVLTFANPSASIAEVLSIGASLIDRWDSDSVTTWIEYADPAGGPHLRAWGLEGANSPTPSTAPVPPPGYVAINRPLRNVGEFGYAYKNATMTLNFASAASPEAAVLDLFGYSEKLKRAGAVDLNTRNSAALAALISGVYENGTTPFPFSTSRPMDLAGAIVNVTTSQPARSRQDLARITSDAGVLGYLGNNEEKKEALSRALAELCQTRTWNLMIDVIAQSGHYPPNATALAQFVVEGEKRYWLHLAIDRFSGEVIDRQLEAVYE
jgi:Tfp pilus assembly protein PilX